MSKPAREILTDVAKIIYERGASRDNGQERSMHATVVAFNAITGNDISEEEGWLFLACLKMVRSQNGTYHEDDFIDLVGYSALAAECASKNNEEAVL